MSFDLDAARATCRHFALVDVREVLPAAIAEIERLRTLVDRIDQTLRVPAAEYVPVISDVFALIDGSKT